MHIIVPPKRLDLENRQQFYNNTTEFYIFKNKVFQFSSSDLKPLPVPLLLLKHHITRLEIERNNDNTIDMYKKTLYLSQSEDSGIFKTWDTEPDKYVQKQELFRFAHFLGYIATYDINSALRFKKIHATTGKPYRPKETPFPVASLVNVIKKESFISFDVLLALYNHKQIPKRRSKDLKNEVELACSFKRKFRSLKVQRLKRRNAQKTGEQVQVQCNKLINLDQ